MISYYNYNDGDPDFRSDPGDVFGLTPQLNFEAGLTNYLLAIDTPSVMLSFSRRDEALRDPDTSGTFDRMRSLFYRQDAGGAWTLRTGADRTWLQFFTELRTGASLLGPYVTGANPTAPKTSPDRYGLLYRQFERALVFRNVTDKPMYVQLPPRGGPWYYHRIAAWDSDDTGANVHLRVPLHYLLSELGGDRDRFVAGEYILVRPSTSVLLVTADAYELTGADLTDHRDATRPLAVAQRDDGLGIRIDAARWMNYRTPYDEDPALFPPHPFDADRDGIADEFEAKCADGIDNDGDGRTDFGCDSGCASGADESE